MMYMIFLVLDDPEKLEDVLEAWAKAGVSGATIMDSTGLHRKRRVFLPMRYFHDAESDVMETNCTLFAVVRGAGLVDACLKATESVVGDLDQPHTGVFASWPVSTVKGVPVCGPEAD